MLCGDRRWTDPEPIRRLLQYLQAYTPLTVVHGGCFGADQLAGELAAEFGFPVEVFPADWAQYGRAAGPIRNRQMLDSGVQVVYAFHNDIAASRGTADMLRQAQRRGLPTYLLTSLT